MENLPPQENGHFFLQPPCSSDPHCDGVSWGAAGWPEWNCEGLSVTVSNTHHSSNNAVCKKKETNQVLAERESAAQSQGDASVGKFDRRVRTGREV